MRSGGIPLHVAYGDELAHRDSQSLGERVRVSLKESQSQEVKASRIWFRGRAPHLIGNIALAIAGKSMALGLTAMTLAVLARQLGPAAFGEYTVAVMFVAFFSTFADQGMNIIGARELARARVEDERTLLGNLLAFKAVVGLAAAITALTLSRFLGYAPVVQSLIDLAIFGLPLASLGVAGKVFEVRLRMSWAVFSDITTKVVFFVMAWLAISRGYGSQGAVAANVIALLVGTCVTLIAAVRLIRPNFTIDFSVWRMLVEAAAPLTMSLGMGLLSMRADALILERYHGSVSTGLYASAFRIIDLCLIVPGIVMSLVFPLMAQEYARGGAELSKDFRRLFGVLFLLAAPLAMFLSLNASTIIEIVAGEEYRPAAASLVILSWGMVAVFLSSALWHLLVVTERQIVCVGVSGAGLILNMVLNFALIPGFGLAGAASASLATQMFVLLLATAAAARHGFSWYPRTLRDALVACGAVSGVGLTARWFDLPFWIGGVGSFIALALVVGRSDWVKKEILYMMRLGSAAS